MNTNFFKGVFEKAGKTVVKEFTSNSKNSTQLRKEAIDTLKKKGYKLKFGSIGSKFK